jgi:hypothetical protein
MCHCVGTISDEVMMLVNEIQTAGAAQAQSDDAHRGLEGRCL